MLVVENRVTCRQEPQGKARRGRQRRLRREQEEQKVVKDLKAYGWKNSQAMRRNASQCSHRVGGYRGALRLLPCRPP
eukprot:4263693-Pleurochrysis_carterae.AAC.7